MVRNSFHGDPGDTLVGQRDGSKLLQNENESTPSLRPSIDNDNEDLSVFGEEMGMLHEFEILEPKTSGGSILESCLLMANSIIGAGIIGLPFSFREAGIWMGILLLIGLTIIVDWTIRLLVVNSKLSGRNSYQELMKFCFGKTGLIAISIFQFAFAFGGMAAYCVIVGDTIPHVIVSIFPFVATTPVLDFLIQRNFVIVLCTIGISYPLSLYRDITKLSNVSGAALLSMVIIVASIIIEGPLVETELRGSEDGKWDFLHPEIFQAVGVISFAFVCHHNSLLIFDSLKKPSLNRFETVTHWATGISMFSCFLMALSGYLTFTDKTQGNILNNFPSDNIIINVARFCFGFNMFTTLPLEAFVCREVIENYYFSDLGFSQKRHVIITTLIVWGAMIISLLTTDLGVVLELTGGFSATALAYILPPACFMKLASGKWWERKKIPAVLCIGFGTVVMFLSTFLSIKKAITKNIAN